MKKLLIAIPTYNRSEDIKFFLNSEVFLSKYNLVDLIIFDSSENESTEKVVYRFIKTGFVNLKYRKMNSNIPSNRKFFSIYEELYPDYNFIWTLHDHTIFNEESFNYIINNLDEKIDFYFLKTQCKSYRIIKSNDLNKFLYDSAWLLGKMGASIVNSTSFLKGVDWLYYKDKYLINKMINFSHIGFYFERAAEMADFNAETIEFPRDSFFDTHRYERLSWENETIRICTQCWGEVINSLPNKYLNKKEVLRTIDKYFLTKYKLIEYKEKGVFNLFVYFKYKKWIKRIMPNLNKDAFKIAILPLWYVKSNISRNLLSEIKIAREEKRNVYIYGAGKHGIECMDFLEYCGVEVDGFLVSDIKGNPDLIRNYSVYNLSDVIKKEKKIFAIIAVMNELKDEILDTIMDTNLKGYDFKWIIF